MNSARFHRAALLLLLAICAPVFLTQCKTTAKSYKDVSYDPAKLKTPAGHGMVRNDYPFDESGTYRKDWVKNNTTGRDPSASPRTEPVSAAPATEIASTGATTPSGPVSYPTYSQASAERASGRFVGPAGNATEGSLTIPTTATTLAQAGPVNETSAPVVLASAPVAPTAPPAPSYHRVASGDTLFGIASRYNTSVADLKRVNGMTSDRIRAGQSLRIP